MSQTRKPEVDNDLKTKDEGGTVAPLAKVDFAFQTFSPKEAEEISLVPMVQQRNWRRHGYLPSHDGIARFDLFSLAELLALKLLAERNGPLMAKAMATVCAHGIVWHVLIDFGAYEGDHERVFSWEPAAFARVQEGRSRTAALLARLEAVAGDGDEVLKVLEEARAVTAAAGEIPNQAMWLATHLFHARGFGPDAIPKQFFIWWADGSHEWCDSVDAAFKAGSSSDPRYAGAVIVLDLEGVARALTSRAGRPFVHVEIDDGADDD